MKKFLRYAVALVAIYFATWTAAYALVLGMDFTHYFEYLALAWTNRGLELPSFIWLFSIISFLPSAGLAVFLLRRFEKKKGTSA